MTRYCPSNNNHAPFDRDPHPEQFTLQDLPDYLDSIPVGLSELTDEGPVAMTREAYSWRTDVPRVFVARSADGKGAALLEIDGDALEEPQIDAYLTGYASHVQGADIRELGRIGAVVWDLMLRQYRPDGLAGRGSMPSWRATQEPGEVITVEPTRSGIPVKDGLRRVQFRSTIPTRSEILEGASSFLGNWAMWETISAEFPRLVSSGALPTGVSCYRPKDGVTYEYGGQWVRAARASLYSSLSDIICVTTPQGHAVLMCLDTQNGLAGCDPGNEYIQPALQWLARESSQTDLGVNWGHSYTLLFALMGARLINDNLGVRGRLACCSGVPGLSLDYPRISRRDGSYYPMVLDAVFVPAETSVNDILSGDIFDPLALTNE